MISESKITKFNYLRGFTIFTLSWSKYLNAKRRNIVTLLILSLPVFLSILLLARTDLFWTSYTLNNEIIGLTYTFYISFAVMLTLFFATFITSDEISDKTISYLLHSPISREELIIWKLLSFLTFSILIFLVDEILFFIIFSYPHLSVMDHSNYTTFENLIELTILNICLYGSFFFFLSVATERPIIYGLLIGFADQILFGTLFPNLLGAYSLSYHIKAIAVDMFGYQGPFIFFNSYMKLQDSYLVVIGLTIVFFGLSILVFRRKEYV